MKTPSPAELFVLPLTSPDKDYRQSAIAVLAIWAVLLLIGFWLPDERAWGINLLAFASPATRWIAILGIIAGILHIAFPLNLRVIPARATSGRRAVAVVMAAGLLAALLYSREALLGDGTLRAMDAMKPFGLIPSELLSTTIAWLITHGLPSGWGIDGFDVLRIVSVLSGVVLVAFLWYLIPRATDAPGHSLIIWILTFGSVRLLAGYVETYTTAFAFFTLWALSAWGNYHGRVSRGWMIGFWALAMLSHVTAVLLIPATLWQLLRDSRRVIPSGNRLLLAYSLMIAIISGGVLTAFYLIQVKAPGTGHFFIALLPGAPHNYSLFSSAHILDFINHWLLVAPAAVLVGCGLWIRGRVERARSRKERGTETDKNVRPPDRQWRFWMLTAALPAGASLVIDPKLGWARDWDLYTLLCAPALVGIAIRLDRLTGAMRRAALTIAVLSSAIWLSFSVDGDAELARFEALLKLDPSRADYGHEIVAQRYRRAGDYEGVVHHYREALLVQENLRYRLNIAAAYGQQGKYDDAERWYRGVIGRDSANDEAYYGLSRVLSESGRPAEALAPALRSFEINPQDPDYILRKGSVLLELHRPEEALPLLETAARSMPNNAVSLAALAQCYLKLNRIDEADRLIKEALRLQPESPSSWINAARVAFQRGAALEAAEYLKQYRARVPAEAWAPDVQLMQDSLSRMAGSSH